MPNYACPRCGKILNRSTSGTSVHFGAVGALLGAALSSFSCSQCGPISRSEFPSDVKSKMATNTILLIVAAAGLLAGVIFFLIWINS